MSAECLFSTTLLAGAAGVGDPAPGVLGRAGGGSRRRSRDARAGGGAREHPEPWQHRSGGLGLAYIARHVIGCLETLDRRVQNVCR
jgi:hypothetical protein